MSILRIYFETHADSTNIYTITSTILSFFCTVDKGVELIISQFQESRDEPEHPAHQVQGPSDQELHPLGPEDGGGEREPRDLVSKKF